jgi:hypothetical protein
MVQSGIVIIFRLMGSVDLIIMVLCRDLGGSFRDLNIVVVLVLVESRSFGIGLITSA